MAASIDTPAEQPGYNNMVLGRDEFPCPFEPREPPSAAESPPPCAPWSVPSVTREGAAEALRRYAAERGLDPAPAAEARVSHMEALHCFRYRLETFTERRCTRWNVKPFTGEEQEQHVSGPAPPPWDFPVEEPPLFRANTKDLGGRGTAGTAVVERQTVELLALTRVSYVWRRRTYSFYISAADGAAIVEDYPESSCRCCSVM